ncbi:hypothetical protein JIY74_28930 [Vibrio harveyi]|nr:hypothetical protein [Vibrio harveyi]
MLGSTAVVNFVIIINTIGIVMIDTINATWITSIHFQSLNSVFSNPIKQLPKTIPTPVINNELNPFPNNNENRINIIMYFQPLD